MVAVRLLGLIGLLAAAVLLGEFLNRRRNVSSDRRQERLFMLMAGATMVLALVGFDGAFGIIPDPGIPDATADGIALVLLLVSLSAYGSWLYLRRERAADSSDG